MSDVKLEHVNISVKNAQKTALDLCTLFDWHIRWEGNAGGGAGYTYHVGNDACYIALYTPNDCLLYTSPSPRDRTRSRMPSSA